MAATRQFNSEHGFSLIELLIAIGIFSLVMGAVLTSVQDATKRYRAQQSEVSISQSGRQFFDQIVRDLHTAGFPHSRLFSVPCNNFCALPLVAVSNTDVVFEGDVDGSGTVIVIEYQLQAGNGWTC